MLQIDNYPRGSRLYTINKININAFRSDKIIARTYIPTGPQPANFDAWRNYIRNILTFNYCGKDDFFLFRRPRETWVPSRDAVRYPLKYGKQTCVYTLERALKLCKPKPGFIERLFKLLNLPTYAS